MNPKIHLAGVWCGVFFLVSFILGFWLLADFLPPHSPAANATEIAGIYKANDSGIRLGMVLMMAAGAFYLPWTVTLSILVRKMEGKLNFLSQCQLIGGLAASMFYILPALIFEVAAFRPNRDPNLILLISGAAWIFTVTPIPPFYVQFAPLIVAIFIDSSKPKVFPRWMGFATLWASILFAPGMTAFFFKTGPFAWDGLIAFWIPVIVFVLWEIALMALAWRHISDTTRSSNVLPYVGSRKWIRSGSSTVWCTTSRSWRTTDTGSRRKGKNPA